MIAVVGGVVDMSRLYLVKSRVQAACDSAVLAGRKAMTTNTYTAAARTRANSMFNFNFQNADYGTTGTSFNSSADSEGRLSGVAATTVPMALMHVFGFGDQSLSVTCSADIQVPNIDIVFVLDVTGSMNETLNGAKKIDSLKAAAKDFAATMETSMAGNTRSQLRYAFVPYSQNVNVGDLFKQSPSARRGELPLTHLSNTASAETRVANFDTTVVTFVPDTATTPIEFNQTFNNSQDSKDPFRSVNAAGTKMSNVDCGDYASNRSMSISGFGNVHLYPLTAWPGSSGQGPSVLYQAEGSNNWVSTEPTGSNAYRRITFTRVSAAWTDNNGANIGQYRECVRRVRQERLVKRTRFRFTNWTYRSADFDTASLKAGNGINYVSGITDPNYTVEVRGAYTPQQLRALPIQTGLRTATTPAWNGCIEERATVTATSFNPIPTGATDLDFKSDGNIDAMGWRYSMHGLTYNRKQRAQFVTTLYNYGSKDGTRSEEEEDKDHQLVDPELVRCPAAQVRNLNKMDRSEFDKYIDTLTPGGNTYLDVGMLWGLRLISPQGMFASRNLKGENGGQISRHIIFLTDGEPAPNEAVYSAYGMEQMSQRVRGGSGMSLRRRHNLRFQALCDAQRGVVSIWTIGFGTSITGGSAWENADTGNLTTCADPNRAMAANNTTELREAFRRIAQEVADLRLVQ